MPGGQDSKSYPFVVATTGEKCRWSESAKSYVYADNARVDKKHKIQAIPSSSARERRDSPHASQQRESRSRNESSSISRRPNPPVAPVVNQLATTSLGKTPVHTGQTPYTADYAGGGTGRVEFQSNDTTRQALTGRFNTSVRGDVGVLTTSATASSGRGDVDDDPPGTAGEGVGVRRDVDSRRRTLAASAATVVQSPGHDRPSVTSGTVRGAGARQDTAARSSSSTVPLQPQQPAPSTVTTGVLSLAEFKQQYDRLIEHSRSQGLSQPQQLTEQQERYLAQNVTVRTQAFTNLRTLWARELEQRRARERNSESGSGSDSDSDSDEEIINNYRRQGSGGLPPTAAHRRASNARPADMQTAQSYASTARPPTQGSGSISASRSVPAQTPVPSRSSVSSQHERVTARHREPAVQPSVAQGYAAAQAIYTAPQRVSAKDVRGSALEQKKETIRATTATTRPVVAPRPESDSDSDSSSESEGEAGREEGVQRTKARDTVVYTMSDPISGYRCVVERGSPAAMGSNALRDQGVLVNEVVLSTSGANRYATNNGSNTVQGSTGGGGGGGNSNAANTSSGSSARPLGVNSGTPFTSPPSSTPVLSETDKLARLWAVGNVIECAYPELDASTTAAAPLQPRSRLSLQRFVIVHSDTAAGRSAALPIFLQGGSPMPARELRRSQYSIIYTGRHAPDLQSSEEPTRNRPNVVRQPPIPVEPVISLEWRLDDRSRVNYRDVTEFVWARCEIRVVGRVTRLLSTLIGNWREVQRELRQ